MGEEMEEKKGVGHGKEDWEEVQREWGWGWGMWWLHYTEERGRSESTKMEWEEGELGKRGGEGVWRRPRIKGGRSHVQGEEEWRKGKDMGVGRDGGVRVLGEAGHACEGGQGGGRKGKGHA
jgi:hypothetical protein